MKILLLSDIHGNYEALAAVLRACPDFERLICLGDVIGYYAQVNEVVEALMERKAIAVRGNHEHMLMHGFADVPEAVRFGLEVAAQKLTPRHRAWLEGLPLTQGVELGGRSFLLVHGSPWRPIDEYLYPDSEKLNALDDFGYDAICWGHTHREVIRQTAGGRWLLNPGSVGQSRTQRGKALALVLETESMAATQLVLPYPSERVVAVTEKLGAGDWVRRSLGCLEEGLRE